MPLYLSTNSDGFNTEGIGAMAQYQLHTYAFSKALNINYAFFGFKNLQHYQYYNITQEKFCNDINKFFNFPNDLKSPYFYFLDVEINDGLLNIINDLRDSKEHIVLNLNVNNIMSYGDKNLVFIENNKIFKEFKKNIIFDEKNSCFSKQQHNISLHIRKKTLTDCDDDPIRELFTETDNQKIINIINETINKFSNKNKKNILHIFSQGSEKQFSFLDEIKNTIDIKFHIEEYPTTSLYHMIHSDVLIMSNSSFSYISHLLFDGITLVRESFYHKTYNKNKYFFNKEGFII